jgi:hypothetical protein
MDANRNLAVYLEDHHDRIESFLGDPDWRERWTTAQERSTRFTYSPQRPYPGIHLLPAS